MAKINITPKEYDILEKATNEYVKTGIITKNCPHCGKSIIFEQFGSRDVTRCSDPSCIKEIRRGL